MTDEQVRRLRELAEASLETHRAWHGKPIKREADRAAVYLARQRYLDASREEVVLALLDERDSLRRERDEMVAKAAARSLAGYRELGARAAAAENDRDAALALLRDLHALVIGECPVLLDGDRDGDGRLALRIDALLGGGEG